MLRPFSLLLITVLLASFHTEAFARAKKPSSAAADWIGDVKPDASPEAPYGMIPLTNGQPNLLISRNQYVLSWNRSTRIVNWASWTLHKTDLGNVTRSQTFTRDTELEQYLAPAGEHAVTSSEYLNTCFDRGHQVPSKDRSDDSTDNNATFEMSNILPQTAYLNRGAWEHLEAYTRTQIEASPADEIWVLAGPIFYSGAIGYIGPSKNIAVPDANFKIVVNMGSKKNDKPTLIAAVIMPNVTSKNTSPLDDLDTLCADGAKGDTNIRSGGRDDWMQFNTDIETIEQEAHIDLSSLKDDL